MSLSVDKFFHFYIFNYDAVELNKEDRLYAKIASIALGVLTLGTTHLFCALVLYNRSYKIGGETSSDNDIDLFSSRIITSSEGREPQPKPSTAAVGNSSLGDTNPPLVQTSSSFLASAQPNQISISDNIPVNIAQTQPTNVTNALQTFEEYRQEQESKDEPVDLIIGRGTKGTYPKLIEKRFFTKSTYETKLTPYRPFTIDLSSSERPHYCADVTSSQKMEYFPDNSVDEMYFERMFLPNTIRAYCIVARILKEGGVFIADFNDGWHSDSERKNQLDAMNDLFSEYNIPLMLNHIPESRWTDDEDIRQKKCSFIKYGPYEKDLLNDKKSFVKAQAKMKLIRRYC